MRNLIPKHFSLSKTATKKQLRKYKIELAVSVLLIAGIYLPFHYGVNGKTRRGRLDSTIGWIMLVVFVVCSGTLVLRIFYLIPTMLQYVILGLLAGISCSIMEKPNKNRVPPLPYKLNKWFLYAVFAWAMGGELGLYK